MTRETGSGHRPELVVRTRRPAGAVLSVRVPREVAVAVDEYASARKLSLSEVVREALENLMMFQAVHKAPTLYASSSRANVVLTSTEAQTRQPTRGQAQTENRKSTLAVPA